MRLKEGFKMRELCGEHMIVADGGKLVNFNKIIALNATAAWLWNQFNGKEFTPADLAAALQGEYEVDAERALADSEKLAADWIAAGIAEN